MVVPVRRAVRTVAIAQAAEEGSGRARAVVAPAAAVIPAVEAVAVAQVLDHVLVQVVKEKVKARELNNATNG